jgi:hypothetical protein
VQHVHKLLSAPEPASGYWVSKSWASNHRRSVRHSFRDFYDYLLSSLQAVFDHPVSDMSGLVAQHIAPNVHAHLSSHSSISITMSYLLYYVLRFAESLVARRKTVNKRRSSIHDLYHV